MAEVNAESLGELVEDTTEMPSRNHRPFGSERIVMKHIGRRAWTVCATLLLAASCANTEDGQPVDVFDEFGVHVVAHAPGECFVCDIFGRAKQYVVAVITKDGLGAGAVVSTNGLVVTNAHVLGAAAHRRARS